MKQESKKTVWKPGTMLYPVPAVMVSCRDREGNRNIITVAWTGIVCSEPPMVYISVRPERFSHHMIEETGEFVINLTTEELCRATDYCGVRSGGKTDKWKDCGLTPGKAAEVEAPLILESPVNLSHGEYRSLGRLLGTFGYTVRKKSPAKGPAKGPAKNKRRKQKS